MIKIKSAVEKKLGELKTMKQKGGFPASGWSFLAKALGLIIDIFEEIIRIQKGQDITTAEHYHRNNLTIKVDKSKRKK